MTLLTLQANDPTRAEMELLDGGAGGYFVVGQIDWGNAVWDHAFSGRRGTQGARAVGGAPQARAVQIPVRIKGDDADELATRESALGTQADLMRRFGGRITWQPVGQTYRQHLDVLTGGLGLNPWDHRADTHSMYGGVLEFVCAPYAHGDQFDVWEAWQTDTIAAGHWTFTTGSTADIAVRGGYLVPLTANQVIMLRALEGYDYGDVAVTMEFATGASLTGFNTGLILGRVDGNNYIQVDLTTSTLVVRRYVAGVGSTTTTAYSTATSSRYWIRGIRTGTLIRGELWTSEPTPMGTPAAAVEYTLTAAEFAALTGGRWGFTAQFAGTDEAIGPIRCEPFTYRSALLPEVFRMDGRIPGDTNALADIHITPSGAGSGSGSAAGTGGESYPVYALAGWAARPSPYNRCWNGGFEADTGGWSVAAVSGVTDAATSITRNTTAARTKYGSANGAIQTPATANTGATFAMYERFKRGRVYLATAWLNAASATTNARIRLGVSGDIASSPAAALNTAGKLHSAVWQPTADRDTAYFAAEVTAATSTLMNLDGVAPVEVEISTLGSDPGAAGTTLTMSGKLPASWTAPAIYIVEAGAAANELVWAQGIDRTTNQLTGVVRGYDRTTAAAHAAGSTVAPLPTVGVHRFGYGALPPMGIIEAESASTLATWTRTADADYRCGSGLQTTAAGAGSASAELIVDPNLLVPDDYTMGDLSIDVYARVEIDGDLNNLTMTLSTLPEAGSAYAAERYGDAGSTGRLLYTPGDSNAEFRFVYLGRVQFVVDQYQPSRQILKVAAAWAAGSSGVVGLDYLVMIPSRARVSSPEGVPFDATYPKFVQSTSETTRVWQSDRTGFAGAPPGPLFLDSGPGGAWIEAPSGQVDLAVKLSSMVPDEPDATRTDSEFEEHAATVHLAVVPRFCLLRGE